MKRLLVALALVWSAGCGDDSAAKHDAGPGDGSVSDGAVDAPPANPFAYCIDKPDQLVPQAPTNGLPCDLFPPAALH